MCEKKEKRIQLPVLVLSIIVLAFLLVTVKADAKVTGGSIGYAENYAGLKWATKLGEGWQSSPTPPTVHGEYVYCAKTTEVVKLDKYTGKIVKSASLGKGQKFTIIPIAYIEADGANGLTEDLIAVPLYDGKVRFFGAENLDAKYTTVACEAAQKKSGIQLTTNIVYDDGYIYFGTWYGDTYDGYFYCYKLGDPNPVWTVTKTGGFYLSDAAIGEDHLYFGSDNGLASSNGGKCTLFTCKKGRAFEQEESEGSGQADPVVNKIEDRMIGNCRAAVVYDGSSLFAATQAGKAYKFDLDSAGIPQLVCETDLGAATTGEATVYNGVIYYGLGNSMLVSLDTSDLSKISSIPTPGYVQGGIALSTAKEAEGELYIYTSYNKEPAGLFAVKASTDGVFGGSLMMFTPPQGMRQFNMTPISVDNDMVIYRNDSGNIMALEQGYTLWTSAGAGGSVQRGCAAEAGSSHSFAVNPNSGYKCVDIIVDNASKGAAASYTFENVSGPHELKAVFMQIAAPKIKTVTRSGYSKLSVSWDPAAGANKYEVYRATKAGGPYSKVAATAACSYLDAGRTTGVRYYYKIKGIYARGSVTSATDLSQAKWNNTILQKTKVKVTQKKGRKALVQWKKVPGATGYEVYRAAKKTGKYKRIVTIKKGTILKYTNKKLKKGKKYYYKVKAVRRANGKTARSAFSNISYCKVKK